MSFLPSTSSASLIVVGANREFLALLTEGFQRVFSGASVTSVANVAGALQTEAHTQVGLLALLDPSDAEIAAATGALDSLRLPRWAVVKFTTGATNAPDMLSLSDWNARTLASVFQGVAATQRLRRENARFRGDFLSVGTRVVHDLRSPLGGILTTAEVIGEVLQDEAPEQVSLTDSLIESTDGFTKIIRQLSVFAKATASPNPRVRLNMSEPFWAAFQQVEPQVLKVGATVRQPPSWPDVEGDASWLQAIWHALLSNSLQHAGRVPNIEAGWTRAAGENRFWLTDGGQVPPEKRARLFAPFHLLHEPNAPRGLGLPTVRRLVELQGGHCGYELIPEGSCFFFTLPIVGHATTA